MLNKEDKQALEKVHIHNDKHGGNSGSIQIKRMYVTMIERDIQSKEFDTVLLYIKDALVHASEFEHIGLEQWAESWLENRVYAYYGHMPNACISIWRDSKWNDEFEYFFENTDNFSNDIRNRSMMFELRSDAIKYLSGRINELADTDMFEEVIRSFKDVELAVDNFEGGNIEVA
jgi:hypothetical protein